jgi:hypothetical protein
LQFIEGGLVYRLPWAMEAVRVRALAHADPEQEMSESDLDSGEAVAAVETGTLNRSAALLMRAGFSSRLAAIKAVDETGATFTSIGQLREWISSGVVLALFDLDEDWPSPESRAAWETFKESMEPAAQQTWRAVRHVIAAEWKGKVPAQGTPLRIVRVDEADAIFTADCERIGVLGKAINEGRRGLLKATAGSGTGSVLLEYLGPEDLFI